MGQNRGIPNLPAPRVFRSDDERLKYDIRVYEAIAALSADLDTLTVAVDSASSATTAAALTAGKPYVEVVYSAISDDKVLNTDSEGILWDDYDVESWAVGGGYRIRASGVLSTTGEPTLKLMLRLDSSLVLSTPTVTLLPGVETGITDAAWWLEALIVCRSSGVLLATGNGVIATGGLASGLANSATLAISTDIPHALSLRALWGTASSSNVITLQSIVVERLPAP